MPINGGTRMLRARRKDINIKPNRRLDRKSSRGMLFENEELRMRTITINAEVEQGQHALKKLRRENEQLRREMWSLRDEYDKMEKLLRKKETDEEDSDQENSYSDDNYSQSEESDDEKVEIQEQDPKEENPDLENEENLQKSSKFGNITNVRTFDGLSVIDEQTEETTTQTTESAVGYGTISRGNSANRTVNQSNASNRMYDEACGLPEFQQYNYDQDGGYPKALQRKKGACLYENGGSFVPYSNEYLGPCENYNMRPSSPYPYSESVQPNYQKRLQVLQNLPLMPGSGGLPSSEINENGWIFPNPQDYNVYVQEPNEFTENGYLADKSVTSPISIEIPVTPELDYGVIRDRAGPDVFIYPQTGYPEMRERNLLESGEQGVSESVIRNVGAEIDKIEISQKSEKEPKNEKMTILTRSPMSHCGEGGEGGGGDVGLVVCGVGKNEEEEQEKEEGKLSMAATFDKNDKETSKHVEDSVSCQNPNHKDVREINNPGNDIFPDVSSKISLFEEMPRLEKPNNSKYQSKLIVTLKTPSQGQSQGKVPAKKNQVPVQRVYQQQQQPLQPVRYGIKPEYSINPRFQTCPNPNVRVPLVNGGARYQNGQISVPVNGLSATLPRTSNGLPKMSENVMLDTSNIPVVEEIRNDIDGVLPRVETLPVIPGQSVIKPVKIPPAPPPRSSSCPGTIIPAPPVGVTALHHRAFRRAKSPSLPNQTEPDEVVERGNLHQPSPAPAADQNPLLLTEPIATSSPTTRHKTTPGSSQSLDTQTGVPRLRKQSSNNTNEESSTEDISSRKSRPSRGSFKQIESPRINKSASSPSFGNFRMLRRKPSENSVSSIENVPMLSQPIGMTPLIERKTSRQNSNQNNMSISSSSGLDSPTKSDRRKRRVSIKFNKKPSLEEERRMEEERKHRESMERKESAMPGILTVKNSVKHRSKSKNEETDATTSERERTNSVSSRTSSMTGRKFSVSSNRTYFNEEKIPWCGCWGNGCV